jgi:hypothetical protein
MGCRLVGARRGCEEWILALPEWLHILNEPWVVPFILISGLGLIFWGLMDREQTVDFNFRWLPESYRPSICVRHEYIVGTVIIVAMGCCVLWLHKHSVATAPPVSTVPSPDSQPFFVSVGPTLISRSRNVVFGEFTATFEREGRLTVIPLNVSIYMSVTNLQSAQSMIDKMRVDIKTKHGDWVPLIRVDCRPYKVFASGDDPQNAIGVDLVLFAKQIFFRWIQPHENVRGWEFFEYPKRSDKEEFDTTFRVTIVDSAGLSFTSPELKSPNGGEGTQGALLNPLEHRNLTNATVIYVK